MDMKRSLVAVALSLAALPGCSASVSVGGENLDTERLEEEILTGVNEQADLGATAVDCPDEIAIEEGNTFECTVSNEAGDSRPVTVTQDDDEGNVSWELGD